MNGRNLLLDTNAVIALLDGNKIVIELVNDTVLPISFVSELKSLSIRTSLYRTKE